MSIPLDSQNALKRRVFMATLSLAMIGATIATVLHYLEAHPHPINLMAPPLLALYCLVLLICLYKFPQSLQSVMHLGLLGGVLFLVVPSWCFTLEAVIAEEKSLVNSLPPLISGLFLLMMLMMIILRPRHLLKVALLTWGAIAVPILTYLIFHPLELRSLRGLDLLIAFGPAMAVQIVLLLFFNRLQDLVDRLYQERLQYYEQIIERQTIRQRAMEHAVTQIHNGPLQSLALLMREVQREPIPTVEMLQRLDDLNTEIRAVGQSLTADPSLAQAAASAIDSEHPVTGSEQMLSEHLLRLGEGSSIDLNHPLHNLFHEVYALTLKRNLPHFKTIKVKIRNFAPVESTVGSSRITLELKRDLCLWLEEALCNVGKHAQGATRLMAIGQQTNGHYILKVQDNGIGFQPNVEQQGSKFCILLAERLRGKFQRTVLPKGGVVCELSWMI